MTDERGGVKFSSQAKGGCVLVKGAAAVILDFRPLLSPDLFD
ncbi:hypothetical protein [Paenibacillus sp. FSL R10-2771]